MDSPFFDMIKGIGAMAEMSKVFYDHCLRVGFDRETALQLTKTFCTNMLALGNQKASSSDNSD